MRTARAINRRSFLKRSASTVVAAAGVTSLAGSQFASSAYAGDLGVVVRAPTTADRATGQLLTAFEAAHPEIKIKALSFPTDKFAALLTAAQTSDQPTDVIIMDGGQVRRYVANGSLLPLREFVPRSRFQSSSLVPATLRGQLYGLPLGAMGAVPVHVNMAVLKKVGAGIPKTYAELKETGAALEKIGIKTFTHPGKRLNFWLVWFFAVYAQTSKNTSIERTIQTLTGAKKFTDDDVVQGLDTVFGFGRDKLLTGETLAFDYPDATTEFFNGRAAFLLANDALAHRIYEENPPAVELDFAMLPKLSPDAGDPQMPGGPRGIATINSKTTGEKLEIAEKLLDFLTSDEQNAATLRINGGNIPVNAAVPAPDEPFAKKERDVASQVTIFLDWYWPPEVSAAFQEGIQAGIVGRSKAVDVAKAAQATLERLMSRGYKFDQ